MTGALALACLQTEPCWNAAERSAKSEKRMRKRSGTRIQVWSQAIPGGGSLRFCQCRQPEQQSRSLTPQSTGARGRAVLTYGRECVAGSRGLGGCGGKPKGSSAKHGRPKVRLELGDGQGGELRDSKERQARASWTAGKAVSLAETNTRQLRGLAHHPVGVCNRRYNRDFAN